MEVGLAFVCGLLSMWMVYSQFTCFAPVVEFWKRDILGVSLVSWQQIVQV